MSDRQRLTRLRGLLFALAPALFAGTVAELLLAGHTESRLQLIPFALCALGLATVALAWLRPARWSALTLRAVMAVVGGGSLLGMWEHFQGNRGFALEVHPEAGGADLLRAALTGADPLLAPGILAVAALVAISATFATAGGGRRTELDGSGEGPTVRRTSAPAGVARAEMGASTPDRGVVPSRR